MESTIPDGKDPSFPVRIYTDGVFDCFHFGHARLLKGVKELFPHVYLVVGVCGDEMTWKEKGKTIMKDYERYESVRHCKWADEVVENAPWVPTVEFLDKIGCHYLAHDPEPYPMGDNPDVYGDIKKAGRFVATQRTEGISTTDIMLRIIRDFDVYVERNIKKGASPEELNISVNKYFGVKTKIMTQKVEDKAQKRTQVKLKTPLIYYFKKWKFEA